VRYHARHRREAFVGSRKIWSLEEPDRLLVLGKRDEYESRFRSLIRRGVDQGRSRVGSVRLAPSKGRLDAMTRTLAVDWAKHGIRVNAVAPGYVETDLTSGFRENERLSDGGWRTRRWASSPGPRRWPT
jgi:NAD(P)-dependent dehydrogenase (short-subunit alcohol dehydrogenase family)